MDRLNQWHSRGVLKNEYWDLFHPTYYHPYFLESLRGRPFVVTVYDMIHESFPEMFSKREKVPEYKKELIRKARKVIAISHSTKEDILRHIDVDEEKIKVIHLASDLKRDDAGGSEAGLPEKYLLFVGERKGYKNFAGLLPALAGLLREDRDMFLVCVGGRNFTDQEMGLLRELRIEQKVIQRTAGNEILASLYTKASAFIFPSRYEGFGIPVLESFNCGCPALLSDIDVFREIAGDAALYFDPSDRYSIENAVRKALSERETRQELIDNGYRKAGEYSWEKTAARTAEVYRDCL